MDTGMATEIKSMRAITIKDCSEPSVTLAILYIYNMDQRSYGHGDRLCDAEKEPGEARLPLPFADPPPLALTPQHHGDSSLRTVWVCSAAIGMSD